MYSRTPQGSGSESLHRSQPTNLLLRHVALACVGRLLFAEPEVEPLGAEQVYLYKHYDPLRDVTDVRQVLTELLAHPAPADRHIVRLARHLNLTSVEVIALVLALMVEEEPMVGRVLAHIQAPVGGSRPALGMLEAALAPLARDAWISGTMLAGAAITCGALQLLNQQAPLPEQTVKIPMGLALLLRGKSLVWPGCGDICDEEQMHLPLSTVKTAARQAAALTRDEDSILVIRSASKLEARAVAVEVAGQMQRDALFIRTANEALEGLGVACLMDERLPVFEYVLGAEGQARVPELAGYHGPRLVLTGPDGQVNSARGSIQQWNLVPPPQHERQQLWLAYLDQDALAQRLAREHIHSSGRIAELARLAQRQARLQRRERPDINDIRRAAWDAEAGTLGSLAQAINADIPDVALVLSKSVRQELQQLLARCRAREHLDASLGVTIKVRYQAGVRCLMTGPSGTGKTLAVSWLATQLGLPLYRVDLAGVVSKYIGETEKNLAALLARAEHSEIVLLFDEADSLFGKRTDIKDSNDRFANSQTNYLLQRIEFYRGIVLLTSNSRDRFDAAFTRRLDKIIEFPLPNPQERRALWQSHLGQAPQLSVKQINQLAVASDLAGGHIRNAVLSAAVSADAAGRAIAFEDVVLGLAGEYRKLGRQFPAELRRYEKR
ncbi:MAG: ATP-binding protein [Gammaproteobacteria bacterium]|nr:ATP-binding protein [Gammaproteobacteria bacterium]